jgi:hypothetical protein
MGLVDLVMPKMGESITEATILKWTKRPGDAVKQDETVLEIATDKVDSEVPSTTEGILEESLPAQEKLQGMAVSPGPIIQRRFQRRRAPWHRQTRHGPIIHR